MNENDKRASVQVHLERSRYTTVRCTCIKIPFPLYNLSTDPWMCEYYGKRINEEMLKNRLSSLQGGTDEKRFGWLVATIMSPYAR